jgi:hypothetical protein
LISFQNIATLILVLYKLGISTQRGQTQNSTPEKTKKQTTQEHCSACVHLQPPFIITTITLQNHHQQQTTTTTLKTAQQHHLLQTFIFTTP